MSIESPAELAKRLLATHKPCYLAALERLALPVTEHTVTSDAEIASLIAWHVGFTGPEPSSQMVSLIENLSVLRNVIRGLPVGALGRVEASQVRRLASEVFVGLEEVLKSAISFSVWALISDHYVNPDGLSYTLGTAVGFFERWLAERSSNLHDKEFKKFSIGDLQESFGLLAKYLTDLDVNSSEFSRQPKDWPRSTKIDGNPFVFPFAHVHAYLDLDLASRRHILSLIKAVPSTFVKFGVTDVRNGLLHHSADVPDRNKIADVLDVIEARVSELANNGLYPLVYAMAGSQSDEFGRRRVTLKAPEGQEVILVRPTVLDLVGFPGLAERQCVVVAGRLADIGEPLRFSWHVDSTYREFWKGFPKRPTDTGRYRA